LVNEVRNINRKFPSTYEFPSQFHEGANSMPGFYHVLYEVLLANLPRGSVRFTGLPRMITVITSDLVLQRHSANTTGALPRDQVRTSAERRGS